MVTSGRKEGVGVFAMYVRRKSFQLPKLNLATFARYSFLNLLSGCCGELADNPNFDLNMRLRYQDCDAARRPQTCFKFASPIGVPPFSRELVVVLVLVILVLAIIMNR